MHKFVAMVTLGFHIAADKCGTVVRYEVPTAVTMKNVVFWDIKPCSYFTGDTLRSCYRVQPVNAMSDLRFSRR
jgi:hypothetical protein